MRTTSLQSVYDFVLRRHGLDPLGDAITHDTARTITDHITNRAQAAWALWEWPDLMPTEECAYRQVWNNKIQYRRSSEDGLPDEVYYIPTKKYYQVNTGVVFDPPVGTLPTNDVNWNPLDPVTTFVARDQFGRLPMGQVFGVYSSNPSLNGCCTQNCLNFRPSEKGITICDGPPTTVFVQYLLPEPMYTMVPFISGKTYLVGDRAFNPMDGNCYRCISNTNTNTIGDPLFWVMEPVPAMFATYLKEGAYADSLLETFASGEDQIRLTRAAGANAKADEFMDGMIDDLLEQGQKHYWLHHYYRHVSWRFDGTLQWPTSGWCCTRPWSGNVVITLPPVPSVTPVAPTAPTGPLMIYLPEITTLT